MANDWLNEALHDARSTFPELDVEPDAAIRFLESKAANVPEARQLRTTDLYLAFACSKNVPAAIATFEALHFPAVRRTLTRTKLDDDAINDVLASLREQLFFGVETNTRPLIETYSGRGDLVSWLRSIALRMASRRQNAARQHLPEATLGERASESNPELQYLRRAHAAVFEESLERVLTSLDVRERNLLRQHYLDGLNVDALGQLYGVHRATAARWVADARTRVLDGVKSELASKMTPSEIESFLRATRDELALRISRVLRVSKSV